MPEELPENLVKLRRWGSGPLFASSDDDLLTYDGVEFLTGYEHASTAERFILVKQPAHRDAFIDLARGVEGGRIVELGIAEGGSTALLALVARPTALLAVDIEPQPQAALEAFLERRDLTATVHTRYGVDQGDRLALDRTVTEAIGDEPIDLVVDDASHDLDLTRTSFEVLFPRLRPGGLYAIEDWNADHIFRQALAEHFRTASEEERAELARALRDGADQPSPPDRRPLLDLAVELLLARALTDEVAVAEVALTRWWLVVRRGDAPLDRSFRLADLAHDHFGYLR